MSHYSPLADVTVENFTHNNMVPFFGSKISQNVDDSRNEVLLENFTGAPSPGGLGPKTEVACFSDVSKHMMPENIPYYASTMDRLQSSVMRTGERPVDPERVGPGTKYDDLTLPSGGFQQDAYRDAKFYPTVDELRTKTHPKTTFEARTIDGQKGANRAEDVGEFNKNRVDTFAEYGTDSMLPNAGISKNTTRSCVSMKETNRKVAHEYSGVPYQNKGDSKYGKIKESTRNQFSGFGSRNDSHQTIGKGQDEDYGRKSMRVYDNQRDLTSANTFQGNLTTLIKSMIAPMSDVLKPTTKEYLVQNAREFGPINSTAIHKATVHDPNDVARTTIKETNIHDTRTGPMGVKPASYAKNNDPTKTTVRETMGEYDKTVNLQGVARQTVYNPKEIARTTVKETTLGASALGGVATMEDGSGYRTANMKAKATNKQITSDNYYSGNADASEADGYKTASMHAPVTSKQIVSDHEHFGMASSDTEAGRSYEDIYNAIMNTTREEMYAKPVPTTSGPKHTNGTETVNLTNLPLDQSGARTNQHVGKIYQNPLSKASVNITKDTLSLDSRENDRLNPDLLKAFRENPYTHSITSFA